MVPLVLSERLLTLVACRVPPAVESEVAVVVEEVWRVNLPPSPPQAELYSLEVPFKSVSASS